MANKRLTISQRIKKKEKQLDDLREKNKKLTEDACIKYLHKLEGRLNVYLDPNDIKIIYKLIEKNINVFASSLGLIPDTEEESSPTEK